MEFDEVVVKESPGLCRCCLSEGCYKDLGSEYNWMGDTEIYADMLLECFDISISQHVEGPNGPNRLICEVCITRLRDSCIFKKQVLDSEKRFVDMLHRGDFRAKAMAYTPDMKQESGLEVEYLDDLDFGDDATEADLPKTDTEGETQSEDITVATLPVKRGRGRPRKTDTPAKPERRAKVAKLEEKPRTSKAVAKGVTGPNIKTYREDSLIQREGEQWVIKTTTKAGQWLMVPRAGGSWTVKLTPSDNETQMPAPEKTPELTPQLKQRARRMRREVATSNMNTARVHKKRTENLAIVLESSNVTPFKYKDRFSCFYCESIFQDVGLLKRHTLADHKPPLHFDVYFMRYHEHTVKADVTDIVCKLCGEKIKDLNTLIEHLKSRHDKSFDDEVGYGVMAYKVADNEFRCGVCDEKFDYFVKLNQHMNAHYAKYCCELCGKGFVTKARLKIHESVHSTEFPCKECAVVFRTPADRTRHISVAHGKKALPCQKCDQTFPTYRSRKEHYSSAHAMEIPTYSCTMCPKKFHIPSILSVHVKRVHDRLRKFQCPMCAMRCFDNSHLRRHVRMAHVRDYKFGCHHCGKKYIRKYELKVHVLSAHKYLWTKTTR